MEPTTNNASAKIISALIIGLIVGFLAGAFWQNRRADGVVSSDTAAAAALAKTDDTEKTDSKDSEKETVTLKVASSTKATSSGVTGSLVVQDQIAGSEAVVSSLDAGEIVWVAVREVKDGKLGNILGAQKVFVGDDQRVSIELLRSTVAGETYRVVVYKDIGTPAFNYREDVVVEGVEATFKAK
ncbi:MAG: hypothetical protein Q7R93_02200 [bacterium]|nr:hypothetical protein [bacterium]